MDKVVKEIADIITDGESLTWEGFDPVDTAFCIKDFVRANLSHFEPVTHWSDCALHNEPAMRKGFCTCIKVHGNRP